MKKLAIVSIALLSALLVLPACSPNTSTPNADSASGSNSQEVSGVTINPVDPDTWQEHTGPVIKEDTAEGIKEVLGLDLNTPPAAENISYSSIDRGVGVVEFTLDGVTYNFRAEHTAAAENISDITDTLANRADGNHNGIDFVVEYNDGAEGVSYWYDVTSKATFCVSVQTAASYDLLVNITNLLIDATPTT